MSVGANEAWHQHDKPSSTVYVCTMHPEVQSADPGACPKCGMALEPVTPAQVSSTQWVCPMHPQIVRDAPGSCPICGMALEPRAASGAESPPNPELLDMRRRFRASVVLTVPGLLLNPMIAAAAMSSSSVSVISNALRLRGAKL